MKNTFKLKVEIFGAKYKVLVNDVPVIVDMTGSPETSEMPINHFLSPVTASIKVLLFPLSGDEVLTSKTECNISIGNYSDSNRFDDYVTVYEKEISSVNLDGLEVYELEESFKVDHKVPDLEWRNNELIEFTEESTVKQLYTYFREAWQWFADQKTELILQRFEKKFSEFENRYSLPEGERRRAMQSDLERVFDDPNFEILDTIKENFRFLNFDLVGYSKLATLVTQNERLNYIMFYNYDTDVIVEFPLYVGFTKKGKIEVFY